MKIEFSEDEKRLFQAALEAYKTSSLRNAAKAAFPEIGDIHNRIASRVDALLTKVRA